MEGTQGSTAQEVGVVTMHGDTHSDRHIEWDRQGAIRRAIERLDSLPSRTDYGVLSERVATITRQPTSTPAASNCKEQETCP